MPGNTIVSYGLHREYGHPFSYFPKNDLEALDHTCPPQTFRALHLTDVMSHGTDQRYRMHALGRLHLPDSRYDLWTIKQQEEDARSYIEGYKSSGSFFKFLAGDKFLTSKKTLDEIRSDPRRAFYLDLYDTEVPITTVVVPQAREFVEDLKKNASEFYMIYWEAVNDKLKEIYAAYLEATLYRIAGVVSRTSPAAVADT
jgi:hypothetical protein